MKFILSFIFQIHFAKWVFVISFLVYFQFLFCFQNWIIICFFIFKWKYYFIYNFIWKSILNLQFYGIISYLPSKPLFSLILCDSYLISSFSFAFLNLFLFCCAKLRLASKMIKSIDFILFNFTRSEASWWN